MNVISGGVIGLLIGILLAIIINSLRNKNYYFRMTYKELGMNEENIQRNPELQKEIAQTLSNLKPGDQIVFEPHGIKIISNKL